MAPFFIIGSPRSGTTLLRLMLTSHPHIVVPPEAGFAVWLYPLFGSNTFVDAESLKALAIDIAGSRKFSTWGIPIDALAAGLRTAKPRSYGDACSSVYRLYCATHGKPSARWGDKNNFYLNHIELLRQIFPEAMYLHIVRDGRDVACSYREVMALDSSSPYLPTLPRDIRQIAETWAGDVRRIRSQLALLPPGASLELRYEDLTANPEATLQTICGWLGTGYSPDMLDFHRFNSDLALEPMATLDWKRKTLLPLNSDGVGRYLRDLQPDEVHDFVMLASSELRAYGYLD